MKARYLLSIALWLPWGLAACLEPEATGVATAERVEFRANDWAGAPASPQRLPLRPRFTIDTDHGLEPRSDALLLFGGAPDAALIADLEQAPLREEHRARLVPSELTFDMHDAVLAPRAALATDSAFTLAVPGWTRTRIGRALAKSNAPLIYRLRTGAPPGAGARVAASWPPAGSAAIGTNLKAAVLAFDGFVEQGERGVWLEGPDGLALEGDVSSGPCSEIAPEQPAIFCVSIVPYARLAPNADHSLVVGSEARDAHGAPVGPWRAQFRTAAGSDLEAPSALPLTCAVDERPVESGCALIDDASVTLRLQTGEPTIVALRGAAAPLYGVATGGALSLRLSQLASVSELALELSLRDSAGNERTERLALRTLAPLATISLVEIRADALGPEPQQEFIELLNYGNEPVDLLGFVLDDRADAIGTPIARSLIVAPQTRVLLVADNFDASDPRDVAPPPGTPLLRVGRALAGSGLSNAGSALFLRDPAGNRVSAAPGTPAPKSGVCTVRVSADMRDGSNHSFDYDAHDTCTPGH